jgi:hypothetical protein
MARTRQREKAHGGIFAIRATSLRVTSSLEVALPAREPLWANASDFPEAFRGWFAVCGDTRNRDYSRANGCNTPKREYRLDAAKRARNH